MSSLNKAGIIVCRGCSEEFDYHEHHRESEESEICDDCFAGNGKPARRENLMRTGIGEYSKNPWEMFYANRDGSNGLPEKETVIQGDYEIIATMHGSKPLQNARASFIVRACSNHAGLLEACRGLLAIADRYTGVGLKEIDAARAAIAAAEGGAS